jgi:hypothetical protein
MCPNSRHFPAFYQHRRRYCSYQICPPVLAARAVLLEYQSLILLMTALATLMVEESCHQQEQQEANDEHLQLPLQLCLALVLHLLMLLLTREILSTVGASFWQTEATSMATASELVQSQQHHRHHQVRHKNCLAHLYQRHYQKQQDQPELLHRVQKRQPLTILVLQARS